jgi:hypothetical protein
MAGLTGAAFLRAPSSTNDHDLGLFEIGSAAGASAAGRSTVGLYHLAWEVETLADLAEIGARLTERGALVGATDHATTKALYAKDPDGIELEVMWLVPADRLTPEILGSRDRSPRWTCRPRSTGSAPTPWAASASPCPPPRNPQPLGGSRVLRMCSGSGWPTGRMPGWTGTATRSCSTASSPR